MEFEFKETVYFSEEDEKEVRKNISNGMTIDRAVSDWISGLDDCDYYIVCRIEDQIIDYMYSVLEREEK